MHQSRTPRVHTGKAPRQGSEFHGLKLGSELFCPIEHKSIQRHRESCVGQKVLATCCELHETLNARSAITTAADSKSGKAGDDKVARDHKHADMCIAPNSLSRPHKPCPVAVPQAQPMHLSLARRTTTPPPARPHDSAVSMGPRVRPTVEKQCSPKRRGGNIHSCVTLNELLKIPKSTLQASVIHECACHPLRNESVPTPWADHGKIDGASSRKGGRIQP